MFPVKAHPVGVLKRGRLVEDLGGGLQGHAFYRVGQQTPVTGLFLVLTVTLVNGTYQVTELQLESDESTPITTEFLRTIPLRTIVDMTVGQELRGRNLDKAFNLSGPLVGEEATLRHTAFTYRLARLLGEAPVKAIMESSGVSRSTATRRVAEARKAGFLGPNEGGPAGGVRSPRRTS